MNITIRKTQPNPPPETVVLELSNEEAGLLYSLMSLLGGEPERYGTSRTMYLMAGDMCDSFRNTGITKSSKSFTFRIGGNGRYFEVIERE